MLQSHMAAQVSSISNLQGPLTTEVNMGQIKTAGHRLAVEAIGDQPLAVEDSIEFMSALL